MSEGEGESTLALSNLSAILGVPIESLVWFNSLSICISCNEVVMFLRTSALLVGAPGWLFQAELIPATVAGYSDCRVCCLVAGGEGSTGSIGGKWNEETAGPLVTICGV